MSRRWTSQRRLLMLLSGVLATLLMTTAACQPNSPLRRQTAQPAASSSPEAAAITVQPRTRQSVTALPTTLPTTQVPPTSFIFPARIAPTPTCPNALPTRLIVQERARVLEGDPRALRMRNAPGTQNPIVAQIPVGDIFFVLEGPVCGETYAWYRVRYQGEEGWVAEGDGSQYYVEPYLPG